MPATEEKQSSIFGSAGWHAEQFGGALGAMLPYSVCNLVTSSFGFSRFLKPLASGALMEGILRPVGKSDGDFVNARSINAITGALTFGTLSHMPGYFKTRDAKNFGIDAPWLVNSFTNEFKRHVVSGAAAGVVDAESRSLLSGHGIASAQNLVESVYSYAVLGGALHATGEVVPRLTQGASINDIVQHSSYLNSRAKLDPVAKELIIEHGHQRVKKQDQAGDIYDLFAKARIPEAIALKANVDSHKSIAVPEMQLKSIPDLLSTDLPMDKYPFYAFHPTKAYSEAFKNYSQGCTDFLGVGFDSVVIRLQDGTALKISSQLRKDGMGTRFFDMPIIEEGIFETDSIAKGIMENPKSGEWEKIQLKLLAEPGRGVNYLVQPVAFTNIPLKLCERFRDHLPKLGLEFWDFRQDQFGYHDGRIVLLDYFAAEPVEVIRAREKAQAEKKARNEMKPIDQRLEEVLGIG